MTTINSPESNALFKEDVKALQDLFKDRLPLPWDELETSVPVANSEKPGFSAVYVNKYCHDHNNDKPLSTVHPSMKTLPDIISLTAQAYADHDCLGERKYNKSTKQFDNFFTFESYRTTFKRQKDIGAGFFKLLADNPFRATSHDVENFILTIYSRNRKEWVLTDLANQHYNICNTSLYDTLGPDTSSYILNLTNSPIVVCSKEKLEILLKIKKSGQVPTLISVVSMDPLEKEDEHFYSLFQDVGLQLVDFDYVEKLGEANPTPFRPPKPEDLYTICFTSGTTGMPKGVEIPHSMAVAAICFCSSALRKSSKPNEKQMYSLSFLPLAHIYERMSCLNAFSKGAGYGFPNDGLPTSLVENLKILKPTVLSCVPRVYSKFEAALKDKLHDKGLIMNIAHNAIKRKEYLQSLKDGEAGAMFLRDRIIFKKFKEALGADNLEYMVSGSAPMSEETARFLRAALNVGFVQGYGLTESFAGVSMSYLYEKDPGSCGPIGVSTEMRLREIPEMNYFANNEDRCPKGELLLRGPQIFPRYYKNPKATKEAIDEDGWFHTGDVAKIDEKGRLYIIDRVKNFFKLAQGEYITPEKIENTYLSQSPVLTQLYVHGDSLKNFLVGISGIDAAHLKKLIQHYKLGAHLVHLTDRQLADAFNSDPKLRKFLVDHVNHCVKDEGLQGFEKIHNVHVDIEPLKISDEVITPTMKIKRNVAQKFFQDKIDKLYSEGSLIKGAKL